MQYRLNEQGILQVKGSSLCVKKLINGQPAQLGDWFDTGDRMECKDGYYTILGRQGDMVIGENGENINPDTVEKLFTLPTATAFCVLGLPGENGQELSMVVQVNTFASFAAITALKDEIYAINGTLPSTSAIRKFYFTQQELMPANAVKISRAQLQKKIAQGDISLTPFAEYQTAMEEAGEMSALMLEVRRIAAEILEIPEENITPDSHLFFDLGATSIQYFSLLTALAERFSVESYQKDTAYRYTVREISEYIERIM